MGTSMIYAGIAIGIAALAAGMFYATSAQQDAIPESAVKAPANVEGSIMPSDTGLAPTINKERWHEDPFGDEAAEVKAKAGV